MNSVVLDYVQDRIAHTRTTLAAAPEAERAALQDRLEGLIALREAHLALRLDAIAQSVTQIAAVSDAERQDSN